MKGLRSAIGFLTILPLAPRSAAEDFAAARTWFPLVGLLLGSVLAGIDLMLHAAFPLLTTDFAPLHREFPPLVAGALLTAALAVLTRALHLDGFMDTCDALLGGFERERRLEILRDPHVGAFAVVGVVSLLLIKLTTLSALPQGNRQVVLLLFPCLSRWGMLLAMELFPYVRQEGLGTAFFRDRRRWPLIGGLCLSPARRHCPRRNNRSPSLRPGQRRLLGCGSLGGKGAGRPYRRHLRSRQRDRRSIGAGCGHDPDRRLAPCLALSAAGVPAVTGPEGSGNSQR